MESCRTRSRWNRTVLFTVLCKEKGSDLRMKFCKDDRVWEIEKTVRKVMGCDGFTLRNNYSLLGDDTLVGDKIADEDVVEVLPDPESFMPSVR